MKRKEIYGEYGKYDIELFDKENDHFSIPSGKHRWYKCGARKTGLCGQILFEYFYEREQEGIDEYVNGVTFLAYWNKEVVISKDFGNFYETLSCLDQCFESVGTGRGYHHSECIVHFCESYKDAFQLAKEYLSEFEPEIFNR